MINMAGKALKIKRGAAGAATLKIAGKTVKLSSVSEFVFVAHEGLPGAKTVAEAALIAPAGIIETPIAEVLHVHVRADDGVSDLCLETSTTAPMALREMLPDGFDRSKGKGHPTGVADLAFECRSTAFEFRFEVGTNRMAVACAAEVPLFDGSTVSGKAVVGLTFPLRAAGHSIGFEWDDLPEAVLFNSFLEQVGSGGRAGLPQFRIRPRAITHLNGGDTRCRVTWVEPGRYAVDGMVEIGRRAKTLSRLRVALDASECGVAGVALSDLLATTGVPHIAALPKMITGFKIRSLAADLDLEERVFAFTGQTLDVFGQRADLALTYRAGNAPSAYVRADLHNGAATTARDLVAGLGLHDSLSDTLTYLPLIDLPLQVRSFGIDTQGPGMFGKFRLGFLILFQHILYDKNKILRRGAHGTGTRITKGHVAGSQDALGTLFPWSQRSCIENKLRDVNLHGADIDAPLAHGTHPGPV